MPYLTPENVPDTRVCRALLIPESSDWLAIFSGALTELSLKWNWEQQGITVDEALIVVNDVIAGFYDGCASSGCTTPDGGSIIRINPETYRMEELVNGDWVEPQGAYALPPTPARTEPTPDERRCLAAANAANALKILYEDLADYYASELTASQAQVLFIETIISIIGSVFGIAVTALLALITAVFSAAYLLFEFLTADMWTTAFDNKIRCYFYECASEDGEVVHFDLDCVFNKIAEETGGEGVLEELRLLLQLGTIMQFLGSQAIDAMGATTAVTSADCDDCENTWCYIVNFTETDGGFVPSDACGTVGDWVAMSGWNVVNAPACAGFDRTLLNISLAFSATTQVDTIDLHYDYFGGTFTAGVQAVELYINNFATRLYVEDQNVAREGFDLSINLAASPDPYDIDAIDLFLQPSVGSFGGTGRAVSMQLTGHGEKPTFLESLGWVDCL